MRPQHTVFITAYWKDEKTKTSGRETLTIALSAQWGELITPAQLKNHSALSGFRSEGPDHLARQYLQRSQSQARRAVCAAARILQFIDTTKLRPSSSYSRAYPGGRSSNAIPGHDHSSVWYDRVTKRYLFVDEPYELAAISDAAKRSSWAQQHGYAIAKPEWPGMYNPDGGTRLYLIADAAKGIPLAPVVEALNKLPAPIVEETWNGESAPTLPYFVSLGAIEQANAEKAKPKAERRSSGPLNSVGYVRTFVGPQRRPSGRMPIEAHAEAGCLLKSVLVDSYYRKGVYNRVDAIRSELDEWTQREYNRTELSDEEFFDLYYHESGSSFARSLTAAQRERHFESLSRVKALLVEYYPDCAPLRALLKTADAAIKSLQAWS